MTALPLLSFRLENFKAVRDSGAVKFGPLTVFIGNNGSGKSSLVEGLETFRDIVVDGVDAAMRRWRGFEHVWNRAVKHDLREPRDGRAAHTHPMTFHVRLNNGPIRLRVEQEINVSEGGNKLFIQREEVMQGVRNASELHTRDAQGKHTDLLPGGKGPVTMNRRVEDGRSILQDMAGPFLRSWQFLSLTPDAMGQPMPQQRAVDRIRLARSGANIAEYLNEIRERDLDAFNGILEALRFVLPFAADLQPTLTSELERAFYLELQEEDFEVPGWLLSTGTLRILALLACLRHPDPPPLLVVEEVENGLDPRTLQLLVSEMQEATATGATQVILTTHSPYLLDLLHLSHIVVVERAGNEPKFWRPGKAKELRAWADQFSPGQLYTMGRLTGSDRK
jgi:predicted ATPase